MRAIHDQGETTSLFGGERIAPGCRGRCSSNIGRKTSRSVALGFAALLISFASAATAITARRHVAPESRISGGANFWVAPALAGYEAAIY